MGNLKIVNCKIFFQLKQSKKTYDKWKKSDKLTSEVNENHIL